MQIALKHSKTYWVEFPEGKAKFKIGYPTVEQKENLDELLVTMGLIDPRLAKDWLTEIEPEKRAKVNKLQIRYMKLFLKYVIKDWEGIVDEDGNEVKCKLSNNELHEPYWQAIVEGLTYEQLLYHWEKMNREIEFTVADKKK